MIKYYAGDVKRINHFMKVYGFAKTIGEMEQLESAKQEVLELAAIVHDIGIKVNEQKYNSSAGK
jgi:HD superfamily phosphohydrolase YqeK